MEIEEMTPPIMRIDLSTVGPLILNKMVQIQLDTGYLGRPGDQFVTVSAYKYTPNANLTIEMDDPFVLEIINPQYALISQERLRIYAAGSISYFSIPRENKDEITGSLYVDISDYTNRTILNGWSWAFIHEPFELKWWHHIVPKTWLR